MTEPRWLDEREERAWRGLMDAHNGLTDHLERQLRRFGLSRADYEVLAHLSEAPGGRLRSFELGRLLRWEKSRLSQHLGRMQTRGLVTRERSAADQRGTDVTITPCGSDLIRTAAPHHVADVRAVLIDHLTPAELDTLTTLTTKIRTHLSTLDDKP